TMDLGQEFFRWEVATATAGSLLGIDAFDQPNVQESKDNTKRLLAEFREKGKLPEGSANFKHGGLQLFAPASKLSARSLDGYLAEFLQQARAGDYTALMAYIDRFGGFDPQLQAIRVR